ncbi:PREDICTED: dnaJ homolog subfamily C member 4-like [Cyphomyrmex costatus]|uniref:dnaJ homolog subfamily C member 4-like n=1 Tax=Cyphomyrmex costatus TaxID=456900 RepID=UPI0008523209|nr:PREDICTED: dnaJ homolog subfamily C member 4-like [Cyphomyrmex costatus]
MAQFLRVCKPEICCVARSYGTRRYQQNHYEILNVSPDASQKEIRQAFIKLSKQLHPDTSGKQGHADFVRLNEAYMILGKENTRRLYDFDLKYKFNPSHIYNSQNMQYSSQWEYEVRTAGGPWPPPPQQPNTNFGLLIALGCIGLGLLQLIFIFYSIKVRKIVALRNALIEHKYQQIRESVHIKADKFSIKDLNSEEDFKEYLTEDSSSEC